MDLINGLYLSLWCSIFPSFTSLGAGLLAYFQFDWLPFWHSKTFQVHDVSPCPVLGLPILQEFLTHLSEKWYLGSKLSVLDMFPTIL